MVKIEGHRQYLFDNAGLLTPFLTEPGIPDVELRCEVVDAFAQPVGSEVFRDSGRRVYAYEGAYISYIGAVEKGMDGAYIRVTRRGSVSHAQFLKNSLGGRITPKTVLAALEVEHLITAGRGLLFHAACIAHEGRAILFTAPSGTGKSTQAELWRRYRNARIINGDRIVIRLVEGGIYAAGIPYSGSSGISENTTMPLDAIVYLNQGQENAVTRLSGAGAFRRVWEGCSFHSWNREDTERALETAMEVIRNIPVYHFSCTPDVQAVAALEAELNR